jgi:type II restriction/modification system DNA methylase subunit YeeA
MNTGNLKSYAPQARKDFIAAVTTRANLLGLSDNKGALKVADAEVKNDIVMIAGRPWPVKVHEQRRKLIARIQLTSFAQTMEAAAYAWFNRLAALRFMELHDYLGHGRRVLSNPAGGLPEVLTHALELAEAGALPGLLPDKVRELKLANQDAELYRQVLIAQCNALNTAMPFLFESIGDETELLLPENLLLTDSVVAKLVQSIPEDEWKEIEIIGWLYQFYISEKKDQVIGKVVKSEDIPAATQLFTPNWIVKYMVQNSLGAQWLATYPDSPIKAQMEYYIEPAEQTDEVNAQLAAITPSSLDPEAMTLIDPACGSGHILVEAYELFKAIYLERGFRQRDVAQLILEKNLFGLDIDERAAQLTGFALMMKARADDRGLFERGVKLNVMALQDSTGFDAERLAQGVKLADYELKVGDLTALKQLFEHATTFGSLIQVPEELVEKLPALKQLSESPGLDLFAAEVLRQLQPLLRQAQLLAAQYDTVVANPPYIGSKFHIPILKNFLKENYDGYEKDVFSAFIDRGFIFSKPNARLGFMSPFVWMFISSHEHLRIRLIDRESITSLVQLEYSGFEGATVPICTFTLQKVHIVGRKSCFVRLSDFRGSDNQGPKTLEAIRDRECGWFFETAQDEFNKIPGSPVAYWVRQRTREVFEDSEQLGGYAPVRQGLATADNDQFMRSWPEVSLIKSGYGIRSREEAAESSKKWFPYNKGGEFRKWFGNNEYLVNWEEDGREVRAFGTENGGRARSRAQNTEYYFRPSVTWSFVSSAYFGVRYSDAGAVFDVGGSSAFPSEDDHLWITGFLCSKQVFGFMKVMNPTLNFQVGNVAALPVLKREVLARKSEIEVIVAQLIKFARVDWNSYERSWNYHTFPFLTTCSATNITLEASYTDWVTQNRTTIAEMKRLEEQNNLLFIDAYGLADELSPDVSMEQITLTVNPAYRYGGNLTEEGLWDRFRQDSMQELVSYAIGCMMGRYSLDEPGLIYANAGNVGFDASRYTSFPADADGIVPLTEDLWFEDDAALRVREFVQVAWGAENLDENMAWLAEGLGQKTSESPDEAIRRYLADKFFKDHLQTYKKRPIYWLFSSGKQGAFQALVYLHRYNAGTLSRLRAEYVVPLTGKMQSRMELLEKDVAASSSTAARNRASKQLESLRKKHLELLAYDEQLRHYADMRIELDLDDGVKVNYGKFGDLLAEVKAVTGGKGDDD